MATHFKEMGDAVTLTRCGRPGGGVRFELHVHGDFLHLDSPDEVLAVRGAIDQWQASSAPEKAPIVELEMPSTELEYRATLRHDRSKRLVMRAKVSEGPSDSDIAYDLALKKAYEWADGEDFFMYEDDTEVYRSFAVEDGVWL